MSTLGRPIAKFGNSRPLEDLPMNCSQFRTTNLDSTVRSYAKGKNTTGLSPGFELVYLTLGRKIS